MMSKPNVVGIGAVMREDLNFCERVGYGRGSFDVILRRFPNDVMLLTIRDADPISQATCDEWASAVGAASHEWTATADRCFWEASWMAQG
jgi:hypothetical protein